MQAAFLICCFIFQVVMASSCNTISTRKATEIWLVGQPVNEITGGKLPSAGEVLRRLFYLLRSENQCLREAIATVDTEVVAFWNRARIPVTQSQNRMKRIEKIYQEWRDLGKRKARMTTTETDRRSIFTKSLLNLFDIAHKDALCLMKNEDD